MTFRNGMSIDSGRDFHAHMERLMRAIERLSASGQPTAAG
jgi:hypothetical protein